MALVVMVAGGLVAVAADAGKNLLKDPAKPESWRLEQHEQAKGTMKADQDGILFDVTNADGENWHVQAFLTGIDFKEGKEYTFSYKIKGDPTRTITAAAGIDEEDWHGVGLQEDVELTKDWKEQTHTFRADSVNKAGKNRIGFILGADKGKVWVKDLSLTEK
jgi:hypothetical protein